MPFRIIRNDITKVKADAIVNTANPRPMIGGGTDRAIYAAAGQDRLLEKRKRIGNINIGNVAVTPAFNLSAKYIIHAVGPHWQGGSSGEKETLKSCYDKSLKAARNHFCKSIAFPLLSTGTYGFPRNESLKIAIASFSEFLMRHEMDITLVVFDNESFMASSKFFSDITSYVDENYVSDSLKSEYSSSLPRDWRNDTLNFEYENQISEPFSSSFKEQSEYYPKSKIKSRQQKSPYPAEYSSISLKDYLNKEEKTFTAHLQQLINKKGMKNSVVYKRANLTKQYFSKLIKGQINPTKTKLLQIAVALRLNLDETKDFLGVAGYALTNTSKIDLIFEYFIIKGEFDIFTIDIAMFDYGLPSLMD